PSRTLSDQQGSTISRASQMETAPARTKCRRLTLATKRPERAAPAIPESTRYCGLAQATSYCDTDAVLREFCGCSPAYFDPAVPLSAKADPGAFALPPGGVPVVSHDCIGWPVACCGEFV